MGDRTSIEWTRGDDGRPGATWNPLVGCSKVSPGCDNCYAIRVAARGLVEQHKGLTVSGDAGPDWNGEINVASALLDQPLRWKRPRRIFVNSLSDLFHPAVDDATIARIFAAMACTPRHTFLVLTKRPQRMAELLNDDTFQNKVSAAGSSLLGVHIADYLPVDRRSSSHDVRQLGKAIGAARVAAGLDPDGNPWPLPNVWLGVSIEANKWAWRADHLRRTPAAVRWISAEPLLGPVDEVNLDRIDWLVAGGESGPGARPTHPDWVRAIRDRCADTCATCGADRDRHYARQPFYPGAPGPHRPVAFFFKQWGVWVPYEDLHPDTPYFVGQDSLAVRSGDLPDGLIKGDPVKGWWWPGEAIGPIYRRTSKAKAGRTLDGRTHDDYPPTPNTIKEPTHVR